MTFLLILSALLFIAILVYTQPKLKEGYNPYDICIDQGYPTEWCFRSPAPNDSKGPCACPPGQKLYRRYGTCYCQTYAS